MGLKSREKGRYTLAIISEECPHHARTFRRFYQLLPLQQLVYRNRTTAQENAVKGSINLIGENNSKYFLLFSSAASPPIELQWADFTLNSAASPPIELQWAGFTLKEKPERENILPLGLDIILPLFRFLQRIPNIEKESSINPGPKFTLSGGP
ncbi:hypothetical protein CEXT_293391 [Caerostris extrusa]|uniref:Uncharacterized protein n=1 Tax=Caerostris extrusa TaxID=172846 RepID=A0AAV4SNN6_CAEEX|nr:hypothetical protein CEXT_293391 [Caerostris extrusa]